MLSTFLSKAKRRPITLMEMLIVLSILSLLGGLFAINIRGALEQQRFRNEVNLVVDEIRLAQDLMLLFNTDVHLKLAKDPKDASKIRYWIETEQQLTGNWIREVRRPRPLLKTIRSVTLKKGDQQQSVQNKEIDLAFLSGGSVMTQGILRFGTQEAGSAESAKGYERFVCLAGFPRPLTAESEAQASADCNMKEFAAKDKQVTELTTHEVQQINDIREANKNASAGGSSS